jgi:hypothetical protein
MTQKLSDPLVSADVDLADFAFMPLDVRRLRDSRISSVVSGEEFRCAVLLWCAAWHQKPAASLPDDDVELSQLAGFGRAIDEWKAVRDGALYGWIKCSDGRLYHPVVAEKAMEAWAEKLEFRWRKECDRVRKANKAREKEGLGQIPLPERPQSPIWNSVGRTAISGGNDECSDGKPDGSDGNAESDTGIPAENALKGQGQGQGYIDPSSLRSEGPAAVVEVLDELEPLSAAAQRTALYRRGKEILGEKSGGFIKLLLKAKSENVSEARAALEMAAVSDDAKTYLGAIVRDRERTQDLRARGEAW